jgi:hypothetical protein
MANTLKFKRGLLAGLPTAAEGEPLFTTDTKDLYIGTSTGNQRFQKYIASGATTQILRGDGSLYSFPLAISSPSNGQVLKFNGTNWVNDSDAGITGSGSAGQVAYFTGATTQAGTNNLFWDNTNIRLGINTNTPSYTLSVNGGLSLGNNGGIGISFQAGQAIRSTGTIFLDYGQGGTGDFQIRGGASLINTAIFYNNNNINFNPSGVGNVGISQASPVTRLDVQGAIATGGALAAHQTDRGIFEYNTNKVAIRAYGATSGSGFIAFNTGGGGGTTDSERVRIFADGNFGINTGASNTGQKLQVIGDTLLKGSGNTSGTVALTVQNSDGNNILRLRNDLAALFDFVGTSLTMSGVANYTILSANQAFYFRSNGVTAGRAFKIFDNTASLTPTSGAAQNIQSLITFAPTSGTATYTDLDLFSTINQTGGANGITRGLYIRPTLTAAADWRSIEWSNNSGWGLYGAGTSNNYLGGSLGIGATSLTGYTIRIGRNMTGSADYYAIGNYGAIQSGVTSAAIYYDSYSSTQSANFNLSQIRHYSVSSSGTFANVTAGGSVTNQYGFYVDSTITGATNNYGFFGNIAAATGRWNLYMNGSASNYLAGKLLVGSTSDTGELLQINGSAKITSSLTLSGIVQFGTQSIGTGMYWDPTNNRLGIGNSAPATQLHVRSSSTTILTIHATNNGTTASPVETRLSWMGSASTIKAQIAGQDKSANLGGGWMIFRTADSTDVLQDRMELDRNGNLSIGLTGGGDFLNIAASTTAKAQINLAAGTAPTTPANGDIWFDGTDLKMRVGGVTKTFTLV